MKVHVSIIIAVFGLVSEVSFGLIRVADVDYSPLFEDSAVSPMNRSIICSDLQMYFSYAENLQEAFDAEGQTNRIPVASLANSRHSKFVKDKITIENCQSRTLFIPRETSDAYTNLLISFPVSTSLLQNARAFVGAFNDGSVTNFTDDAICKLFCSFETGAYYTETNNIREELKSYCEAWKYTPPCIIDFSMPCLWNREEHVPCYVFRAVPRSENSVTAEISTFVICYNGAKWVWLLP